MHSEVAQSIINVFSRAINGALSASVLTDSGMPLIFIEDHDGWIFIVNPFAVVFELLMCDEVDPERTVSKKIRKMVRRICDGTVTDESGACPDFMVVFVNNGLDSRAYAPCCAGVEMMQVYGDELTLMRLQEIKIAQSLLDARNETKERE